MSEQLILVPPTPLAIRPDHLDIHLLAHEEVPEASRQLVDSIRTLGLLQPIVVRETHTGGYDADGIEHGEYHYDIVAGRRRLAACRALGHLSIPVVIVESDLAIADVATLAENALRTANPIAEFEAIQRLVAAGAGEKEIAAATGMARQTIRARLRLLGLSSYLATAFRHGQISTSVAEALAKLPAAAQQRAVAVLRAEGKVTAKDVRDLRLAKTQAAAAALPHALFDLPVADAADDAPDTPELLLAQRLQAIIADMPPTQPTLIGALEWVAELLADIGMGGDPAVVAPPVPSWGEGEEEPEDVDTSDQEPYPAELADDERYPHLGRDL